MKLKRLLSMMLTLTVFAGILSFEQISVSSAEKPSNIEQYFYFSMEYTDYDGEENSQYLIDDYPEKYRIMNPVKVYENGFYDLSGNFISFIEVCSNFAYEDENLAGYIPNDDTTVRVDNVYDAVYIILAYYKYNNYSTSMTDDQSEFGSIYLDDYSASGGFISSITDTYMGEFDSTIMAFFKGSSPAGNGMSYYSFSDGTISQKDVFRIVCDNMIDSNALHSYTPPACDELISSIGDYYELLAENTDGMDSAESAYSAALESYFTENAQNAADELRDALSQLGEKEASVGDASIYSYQGKDLYVSGSSSASVFVRTSNSTGELTYQWYRDGVKLDGATGSSYSLTDEPVGKHTYRADITATVSAENKDFKSLEKEITIYAAPTAEITGDADLYTEKNKEITLKSISSCDTKFFPDNKLTYQWYKSASAIYSGIKLENETSDTLTITADEYGESWYYVQVTDSNKHIASSNRIKVSVVPSYSKDGWDGTFEDDDEPELDFTTMTYKIGTPEQLAWYAAYVNEKIDAESKKENPNKFAPVYNAILTADIDLNSREWTPIGNTGEPNASNFTFDGNGHTISGLYINESKPAAGLFGYIGWAITGSALSSTKTYVKNLTVDGVITGPSNTKAIVAANAGSVTFENVTAKGEVICKSDYHSQAYCAAAFAAYEDGCTFENCVNYANVTADENAGNKSYIAGFAAYQKKTWGWGGTAWYDWDYTAYRKTVIKDCINLGQISGGAYTDPFIAYINNKDNHFDDYRDMTRASTEIKYTPADAVEVSGNIYLAGSSKQGCTVNTYPEKSSFVTGTAKELSKCADGKCVADILNNTLTASGSIISGSVSLCINNNSENAKSAKAFLGIYSADGKLLEVMQQPCDLEPGYNIVSFKNISANGSGEFYVKAMLWNNSAVLMPLSAAASN